MIYMDVLFKSRLNALVLGFEGFCIIAFCVRVVNTRYIKALMVMRPKT